jgi:hypothetical protein
VTCATPPLPPQELLLDNPNGPYSLDPTRGDDETQPLENVLEPAEISLVPAEDTMAEVEHEVQPQDIALEPVRNPGEVQQNEEGVQQYEDVIQQDEYEVRQNTEQDQEGVYSAPQDQQSLRNAINAGYNLRPSTLEKHIMVTLSIKESKSLYGEALTDAAVMEELENCVRKQVFEFQHPTYRTTSQIPSKMFLTPKKLPDGTMDKMKARLVAGGHRQDRSLYSDVETSSPTAALSSVLMVAALAAHKRYKVMTLDHKAAYLNAAMVGHTVIMTIGKEVSNLLCQVRSEHRRFLRPDGTILVKLRKALYGCIESAVLWYNELSSTLEEIGFNKNPYDECAFMRANGDDIDHIILYVDDLMLTARSQETLDNIAETLKSKYKEVTVKVGQDHNFLGIHWAFDWNGGVTLSMDGYLENILKKYGVTKMSKTPATEALFQINQECAKLGSVKQQWFHSCVMELHYLAKRIRGDILTAVSFCATRVLHPDKDDEKKLDRISSYLLSTRGHTIVLRIGDSFQVRAYVDASFDRQPNPSWLGCRMRYPKLYGRGSLLST